uniref:phytanoyl-CoA dioxygenase family protein n=3 Tax=Cephaloticoccus sp. TaxID=1985742 RepID=UPI00404A8AE2
MSTPTTQPEVDPESADILQAVRNDGYAVLRNVIPADEIGAVRDSITQTVSKYSTTPPPNGVVTGLLRKDLSMAPYLTHPRFMTMMTGLFGEHFKISFITGLVNNAGVKRGPMHADWPYNQNAAAKVLSPYPDVMMHMVTMWMLSDYTIENGGTHIIPGSHKRGYAPRFGSNYEPMATYKNEVQMQGKAGDVGIFDARTWHATAENKTNEPRIGVLIRYCPWWLNLKPLTPGSRERRMIVGDDPKGLTAKVEPIPLSVFDTLPENIKPLLNHMVDETC